MKIYHGGLKQIIGRLIAALAVSQNISTVEALTRVYTSWISDKIDDYNSSMYYESPEYLYASYMAGAVTE